MELVLDRVSFSHPGKELFREFSLALAPGQRLAVMGPSGSGKTTLLRLMAGLEQPQAGRVTGIPEAGVSMVFQENRLVPGLTALENLALAAPRRSRRELLALLAQVGLEKEAASLPAALSGGMARRVALARAVALGSPLFLLDEPFTGLDSAARQAAAAFLLEHAAGSALVLVAHHPEEAALLGARVLTLGPGA